MGVSDIQYTCRPPPELTIADGNGSPTLSRNASSASTAFRTALSLPLAFWVHSLCCDMQTQTLKNVSVVSTQETRFSTSSTVLNGQPDTHGLPSFLIGSPGFGS